MTSSKWGHSALVLAAHCRGFERRQGALLFNIAVGRGEGCCRWARLFGQLSVIDQLAIVLGVKMCLLLLRFDREELLTDRGQILALEQVLSVIGCILHIRFVIHELLHR